MILLTGKGINVPNTELEQNKKTSIFHALYFYRDCVIFYLYLYCIYFIEHIFRNVNIYILNCLINILTKLYKQGGRQIFYLGIQSEKRMKKSKERY